MSESIDFESLPVLIRYVGETARDGWSCDQWSVQFDSKDGIYRTDYFTGIGLRKTNKNSWDKTPKPVKPTIKNVMYSMLIDSEASDMAFDDWCEEFGYSDDSISALNIYKKCLDTARSIRKHFSNDQISSMREALQDY